MALRPSKITSEVLQTCNKFFSSSRDASLKSKVALPIALQKDGPSQPFRYKITNLEKPEGLPELNFKIETTLFAELQPSAKPEFKFDCNPPKWAEKSSDNSPFPSCIKTKSQGHNTYSDQQKAEDKMMKYKMTCFSQHHRSFSTLSTNKRRQYSTKGPADNSGKGSCKQKINKCYKAKPKECRLPNKNCPKFKILTCEQAKESNCNLNYLDPHCTKKFAPYPSYSESCAEHLADDPSECQQCPWRTCDNADSIEPGKPVRNKRHFSTSCSRHLDATAGVVVGPLQPPPVSEIQEHLCDLYTSSERCGKSKPPCKQPPGPCEVRRQKEEEKKREKGHYIPPKPKKASEDADRMVLTSMVEGDGLTLGSQGSWIDIFEGEQMYLDKKKHKYPNCPRNKKPKRPEDNKKSLLLSDSKKGGKKRIIKGDEGHPPPCEEERNPSLNCPETPIKKPKYKKRPLTYPYYKRPDDPYNPSNGK